MTIRASVAAATGLSILVSALPAASQALLERGETVAVPTPPAWALTVGALGGLRPDYQGSDDYTGFGAPLVDLRYRDLFFLSTRDGIGLSVFRGGGFAAGPLLRYRFGRDQDDNDALRGLGDIGGTVEGGAFLRWQDGGWVVNVNAAQGLNGGGHRGFSAYASVGYGGRLADRWSYSVGPNITWADSQFLQTWFGVTPDQAVRSGYRPYSPGSGVKDVGLSGTLTWRFADRAAAVALVEVSRLLDGAADSPIVDQRGSATQAFLGLGLSYRFGW